MVFPQNQLQTRGYLYVMQKAHKSTHFKAKLIHADVKRWGGQLGNVAELRKNITFINIE